MGAKDGAHQVMSNYEEEQELEIEALTSIFEEGKEFERVAAGEFKLKLVPFPAGEEENHVGLTLRVKYTPEYPDSAPEWELEDVKLPDEKTSELKAKIEETIESSLGMAMVYTVAELCQDFLKENNTKELSMHEQMLQRMKESSPTDGDEAGEDDDDYDEDDDDDGPDPEEEWKGLAEKNLCSESERITIESFGEWKLKFEQEMVEAGVLKRGEVKAKSGKQFFLESSKENGDADAAGKAGEASGKEGDLVYNAALFNELDDEDLDDLSAGED